MRRGFSVLIVGGILLVASVSIAVPAIYALASLAESMPTDISTKDVINFALNMNQTAIKESLRGIGIDVGLAFFELLINVTLMSNGIIALVGGIVLIFIDKRRRRRSPILKRLE
jgi:hypothetical protein